MSTVCLPARVGLKVVRAVSPTAAREWVVGCGLWLPPRVEIRVFYSVHKGAIRRAETTERCQVDLPEPDLWRGALRGLCCVRGNWGWRELWVCVLLHSDVGCPVGVSACRQWAGRRTRQYSSVTGRRVGVDLHTCLVDSRVDCGDKALCTNAVTIHQSPLTPASRLSTWHDTFSFTFKLKLQLFN